MNIKQARKLAQSENTPTEILDKLAKSHDKLTRQYVATNPNTPVKTLFSLGEEFPQEIIINPVFDLLFLENPESYFIQMSLARSPTTPLDTLEKLASKKNQEPFIMITLTKNPNSSAEVLDKLADNNTNLQVCHAILKNPLTSTKTLEKIAGSRFPKHRVAEILLIKHPNVSETIIKIAEFVNGSKNTPTHILEKLADHPNDFIRKLVAKHQKIVVN